MKKCPTLIHSKTLPSFVRLRLSKQKHSAGTMPASSGQSAAKPNVSSIIASARDEIANGGGFMNNSLDACPDYLSKWKVGLFVYLPAAYVGGAIGLALALFFDLGWLGSRLGLVATVGTSMGVADRFIQESLPRLVRKGRCRWFLKQDRQPPA
jgi:hypothetical protein